MSDPFYRTATWLRLRKDRLRHDHHTCTVPGCGQRATVVDHIVPRRAGGPDVLTNLRSLCREHDQQVKERPGGKRANKGRPFARGYHADGSPRDPTHPWYRS